MSKYLICDSLNTCSYPITLKDGTNSIFEVRPAITNSILFNKASKYLLKTMILKKYASNFIGSYEKFKYLKLNI